MQAGRTAQRRSGTFGGSADVPARVAPRGVVRAAKRLGRATTELLPGTAGEGVRRWVRAVLVRAGLAVPISPPSTHTRDRSRPLPPASPTGLTDVGARAEPARPRTFQATPDLATITDPESGHAMCPMCGTVAEEFLPFGVKVQRPDCRCPSCGSLERHRLVWLYFAIHTDLFDGGRRFLHIAPEPTVSSRIRRMPGVDYVSGDIVPGKAMVAVDLTEMGFGDGSFDVIYASHVLEHIPEDVQAMRELRRVLAPDGWAVLEVPIHGSTTREDPTVTDPDERNRLFGQHDHVRMYGHDGEYERRLRRAGFAVTIVDLAGDLGPAAARRYRLHPEEQVYVCRR